MACYMPVVLALQSIFHYRCHRLSHNTDIQLSLRLHSSHHTLVRLVHLEEMPDNSCCKYLSEDLHGFSCCTALWSADILECHNIPVRSMT